MTDTSEKTDPTRYVAECACGQASITVIGKPRFVNACSCRKCQRQGSGPLGMGVFFSEEAIASRTGTTQTYSRKSDKGNDAVRHFCPHCGSALYWFTSALPGFVGVSWGALDHPEDFTPKWLVWAKHLPEWLDLKDIKHFDEQPE